MQGSKYTRLSGSSSRRFTAPGFGQKSDANYRSVSDIDKIRLGRKTRSDYGFRLAARAGMTECHALPSTLGRQIASVQTIAGFPGFS